MSERATGGKEREAAAKTDGVAAKCPVCGADAPVAPERHRGYGPRVQGVGSRVVVLSLLGLSAICMIFLVALLQQTSNGGSLISRRLVEMILAGAIVLAGGAGVLLWNSLREDRRAARCARCGAPIPRDDRGFGR